MKKPTKNYGQKFIVHRLFGDSAYTQIKFLKIRFYASAGKEYEVTKFLKKVMRSGDVFFDIGANLGQYALRIGRMKDRGVTVYAFEPVSGNYRILSGFFGKYGNVNVERFAVSDFSGKAEIHIPIINRIRIDTQATLDRNKRGDGTGHYSVEEVGVVTVDEYVRQNSIKKVNFIKSDTEGEDAKVIMGGKEVISRDLPVIITEDVLENESSNFLTGIGYRPYFGTKDGYLVAGDDIKKAADVIVTDVVIYLNSEKQTEYQKIIKQK